VGPPFPIENRARLSPCAFERLAVQVAWHRSIKRAIDWLAGHQPPLGPEDILAQDEYSHDFVVAYPGGLWLVYDCT
jgi:hypothetical protein